MNLETPMTMRLFSQFVRRAALALGLATLAAGVLAQDYPTKPVKIIVGYVPGGGPDFAARTFGAKLTEILGQPFVVENRPGAGATTATAQVAKSPADGYTLLLGETGQLFVAPYIYRTLGYDTAKDFTPISLVGTGPLILVAHPKTGITKATDLIREAKARPGKLDYGSSGIGTIHNIAMEVFKADGGMDLQHVPFKGSGQSVSSILAGDVPVLVTSMTAAGPHVAAGKLNLLAVTSGARMPSHPDVPSLSEFVKDYDYASEMGFLAPAGLPPAVLAKLAAAIKKASEHPDVIEAYRKTGTVLSATTPESYAQNIQRNLKKYERAVKIAKLPMAD